MTDFYELLGVARDATDDDIKKAYRAQAMKFHPDRNPGDAAAEAKFKDITAAYETLRDKDKRAAYDSPYARDPFGGFGGGGTTWHFSSGAGAFDFDNLVRQFHGAHVRPVRNQDLTVNYNISLIDAFHGTTTNIRFTAPDGKPRDLLITVPAGVDTGHRIKMARAGDQSIQSLPPGDLYVQMNVLPLTGYTRMGQNLSINVSLDALDAMIGTSIEVPTIDGSMIRVTVPAGTQPGDRLRVSQKGMPALGTKLRGDLYVAIFVTVPRDLPEPVLSRLREIKGLLSTANVQH